MDKFIKILKYFLGLVVIVIIISSFVIGLPKFGKVVDAVTKKPLEGISVTRITTIGSGGHFDPEIVARIDYTFTDEAGKFSLNPYVKFRFPFQGKKDVVYVNIDTLRFANSVGKVGFLSPTREDGCYGGGFENKNYIGEGAEKDSWLYKSIGRKIYYNVSLVPIVTEASQCNGNTKCIEENKRWGRSCAERDDLCPCRDLHSIARYSQPKAIEEELLSCNKESSDAKVAECLLKFKYGPDKVIFTDSACSKINSELGRNYCYYWIASNARFYPREVCDKITAKPIPNTRDYMVFAGDIQGNNYLDACLRAYELYKEDKGEESRLNF